MDGFPSGDDDQTDLQSISAIHDDGNADGGGDTDPMDYAALYNGGLSGNEQERTGDRNTHADREYRDTNAEYNSDEIDRTIRPALQMLPATNTS